MVSRAPGLRSCPRIFLSLMTTYSSSITFLPGGSKGTPLDSLSRSERRSTNTTLPSLLTRSRAEAGVRSPRYPRRLPKSPRTRGGTCTGSRSYDLAQPQETSFRKGGHLSPNMHNVTNLGPFPPPPSPAQCISDVHVCVPARCAGALHVGVRACARRGGMIPQ